MSEPRVNMPILSVEKTIKHLSNVYCEIVGKGISPKVLPSVMLWGPPGVGKSQAIRQVADRISAETGKKCVVTDVRLLLFNPIDLRGIPTANEDKTLAVWLKPQIFQMDPSSKVVNILFLDEISAAPQSVQAAAYQITLDRIIGEHKLPENCIVIAAGNRVTDKSVAFKMPKALANRLCHMEVESNFESWRRWAISSGVSYKVVGFLSFRHDYLIENESSSDALAFPTPRSWEMVSRLLNMSGQDQEKIYSMISGCVGSGIASEFCSW
ncbi:MAG: AAA family ATPase, partial [Clostridia bacterium]|nr:AAA family ATPase [Clostridia bacterium]